MPSSPEKNDNDVVCPAGFKIISYPRDLKGSPSTRDYYQELSLELLKHCEIACSNGQNCRIKNEIEAIKKSILHQQTKKF